MLEHAHRDDAVKAAFQCPVVLQEKFHAVAKTGRRGAPAIESAGLVITDVEVLRLHYAETLRAWRQRLAKNSDEVVALYDEQFLRMWEFYLSASEAMFRYGGHVVFQIQMAKNQEAVPITRAYLDEGDR